MEAYDSISPTLLVEALKAEEGGREVKYTKYAESKEHSAAQDWMVGHNVWTKAYGSTDTWDWLFSQLERICEDENGIEDLDHPPGSSH